MSLRIEVTAEDIAAGSPGVPDSCAIAKACKRMGFPDVSVGGIGSRRPTITRFTSDGDFDGRWQIPESARQWATMFDHREPVEPIAFDAEPVDP